MVLHNHLVEEVVSEINRKLTDVNNLVERLHLLAIRDDPEEEEEEPEDVTGLRVRTTHCDRNHGRTGVVISARGQMYWNILLEADRRGRRVEQIYKTRDGFEVIN